MYRRPTLESRTHGANTTPTTVHAAHRALQDQEAENSRLAEPHRDVDPEQVTPIAVKRFQRCCRDLHPGSVK